MDVSSTQIQLSNIVVKKPSKISAVLNFYDFNGNWHEMTLDEQCLYDGDCVAWDFPCQYQYEKSDIYDPDYFWNCQFYVKWIKANGVKINSNEINVNLINT